MKRKTLPIPNSFTPSGSYVMRSHKAGEIKWHRNADGKIVVDVASMKKAMGAPLYEHPVVKNHVVSSAGGTGRNLLLRQMSNDITYPIVVSSGEIGTGTATPVDTDTDLVTPILTGINVALFELSNDTLVISFFIPDGDLANGTYKEFLVRMGLKAFARSLILPTYTKGTGIDTTIEYTLSSSSA